MGINEYYFYAGYCKGYPERYTQGGIGELCRHILLAKACEMLEDRYPGVKNFNAVRIGRVQWNNDHPFMVITLAIDSTVGTPLTDIDLSGKIHLETDRIDRFLSAKCVKEAINKICYTTTSSYPRLYP